MKFQEMRQLVQMRPVELDAARRRTAASHSVGDLRRIAKRWTPGPVFDYVDGGADEEQAVRANVAAFRAWRFLPRVLADVSGTDTSTTVLGESVPVPLVLCPTGYTRMMHRDGEIAVARSAARHGLPYTLSTMATTSIEQVREKANPPDLWFQLYVLRDRERAHSLVDRAAASGYRVLMVTVDTVVSGNRVRDKRNGLTMPPELSLRTVASVASRPGYWYRLLSGPALEFANVPRKNRTTIAQNASIFFDPSLAWDTIEDLRARWRGKLILKGPLGPGDARRAVEVGVDGIQLSNHGGRQLERAVAPVDLIAPVREAVGPSVTLTVDSGIRHGADIVIALALGADAGAIGRAYLYGLMAGGELGVDRVLDLLSAEVKTTMQLLGVTSVADLRKRGRELLTKA